MTNQAGEPQLDIERIVRVFALHNVDYLLIGGVATRLYGAQRLTYDLDVVASREPDNLDRVADALRELGAFLRVGARRRNRTSVTRDPGWPCVGGDGDLDLAD